MQGVPFKGCGAKTDVEELGVVVSHHRWYESFKGRRSLHPKVQ